MRCETARASLIALLDGELGGLAVWSVRRHVARCGDCARELVPLRNLNGRLKSLDVLPRRVPAVRRISAATATPASDGSTQQGRDWRWRAAVPALGALGVLTLVALAASRWA